MERRYEIALYMMSHHKCNGASFIECKGKWHSDYLRYGDYSGRKGFFCKTCFPVLCPESNWEQAPTLTDSMWEIIQ